MIASRFGRFALAAAALCLLAACGGSQPAISAPGASVESPAIATHVDRSGSWMLPEARSGDLLYVTGGCGGTCVLSYPAGKLVGSLSAGFIGLCSDKHGNVFLTNGTNVVEYAHGGKSPIRTLSLPAIYTIACSVDGTTGNLAVTFQCSSSCGPAIGIFQDAQGTPTIYTDPDLDTYYPGYDNKGNLFIDGYNGQQFGFAELPRGSDAFANITLDRNVGNPGQVQWDGKYVTVEGGVGAQSAAIYRVEVSGSTGTIVGTTQLRGLRQNAELSWIQGRTVVVPYAGRHGEGIDADRVGLWKYPAGGRAMNVFTHFGNPANFSGVTVSVAPRR